MKVTTNDIIASLRKAVQQRDRYKMLADSAGALAEYRMYRIMELEEKLRKYKNRPQDLADAMGTKLRC